MATEILPAQHWSGAGAISEAGERLRNSYMAPNPHPWRPTMGYENVELMPLPALTMTNKMMEPVCTPAGMITDGIRFPNIVTGFDKNPSHAARAALYTRYTPYEWVQNALSHYNESDTNRNIAERVRADAFRLMRMTDEKTACDQRDSGRRLGERITDTTFWRNEVATELEKNMIETNLLQDTRRAVEKAYQDTEAPLHIAQECLYHREHRQGIDLVHDQPEQYLLKEIENLKECQMKLSEMKKKIIEQLRTNRAAQHELETDVKSKESALAIDSVCHHLNNFSRGINYYGGIERYDATVSTPDSWAEHSNRIVIRSQAERSRSSQMRLDADNLINACASEIWNSWNDTNSALSRRSTEVLEAKNKTQMHLHRVQQEIFDVEKSIELLRKAIMDKSNPMKVAQTRLEARSHRKDIELCKDDAQSRLVREVEDISETVESLHKKMQEAEAQHQQLLLTKSRLEADLHVKVNSLFIDREKCLGMRSRMIGEMKATDQKVERLQLKERIAFWLNEVASEREKMMQESKLLEATRRAVEKAYQATEAPLHIAQECLYHREQRKGIDLVHDLAELYLFKEIRSLNNCQSKLFDMNKKVIDQLQRNRSTQNELEKDFETKESFTKPGLVQLLLKSSKNLNEGINKIRTKFVPESWEEDSFKIVTQSQKDREKSSQLRLDADNFIDSCSDEISNSWNETNNALSKRVIEALEANTKTEKHLLSVQQEIFEIQKNIELMRKAILDKSNPLKVAQTRLEARSHRKGIELCNDDAQTRLIQEVKDINETIQALYKKIKDAEAKLQQLQMTRSRLEADLHIKINSLFIDREKCLGMRRSIPITTKFK